ncbi:Ig-like domain repeat protein [Streptomyces sp. NBC_01275]|uniref:Ig-like domain repeat protein n=1 Tax=Streptomyces sp. NBC_01275 TaxID=2903807 RepID=UPI00224D567F|nr:Ig-like domain repeat protein [Streptomyces sp. NBC_01275]MCX4763648.1 Ig-like domain repeat protein [Streptomyces sp. NBC_01275]
MRRTRSTAALVAAAVVAGGMALASPAYADPTPAGTFRQLVGVGSDTTQDVLNALAGETVNGKNYGDTAVKSASGARVASYDAIGSATVQTRSGGPSFVRPNGSGAGLKTLSAALTGVNFPTASDPVLTGQVDFARSSSGPSASGNTLTYIPFARDAVGIAVRGSGLDTLTAQQLFDIYKSGGVRTLNGQTLHPVLPQANSGTRKFFLAAIGLTEDKVDTTLPTAQENQANAALTQDGALVPFSVGSWIAQNNHIAPDFSSVAVAAGAHLASVQLPGDTGGVTNPVSTVNGELAPVTHYYENATFGRDVYNVVPSRAIDPTSIFFDKDLYDVFVTSGDHEAATASDAAEEVIADFGFLNESYNGSVNLAKHARVGGLEPSNTSSAPAQPTLKTTVGDASVKLDWTPSGTGTALPVTDYRVTLTGSDGAVVAAKDLPATARSYSFTGLATGAYTATVTANNLVGTGTAATWTGAVKYASTVKATTATTAYGKAPKVAVTVTGSHSVVPGGKVTVKEGSTTLGTGTLSSAGKVTVSLSNHLKVATHSLTVSYGGSAQLNSSSTTVSLKVAKASPAVSTSAPTSVKHTARAKVTVKVTATGTTPTGTVRIYEGSRVIATGTLSGGKVTVTLPKLSKARHTLHASYAGSTTVSAKNGANFVIKST